MQQYYIDNGAYPASSTPTTLTEICNTGATSSPSGISCGTLIDLSILVPTYIPAIPVDPQGSTLSFITKAFATTNGTGYQIGRTSTGRLMLKAPQAELGTFIALGTSTVATVETPSAPWACGDNIHDGDGNAYNTVLIGSQCWMADNLNYDGSPSGNGCKGVSWANHDVGWCGYYNYAGTPTTGYGLLYQWSAANQSCPTGWHLPSDNDYKILEMALGMSQGQADTINWRGAPVGTDLKQGGSSGFNALLAGYHQNNDQFYSAGDAAYFWTSDDVGGSYARDRLLLSGSAAVARGTFDETGGMSVRCVMN
jgi:uncharacterized protein (TIGR02145 family)